MKKSLNMDTTSLNSTGRSYYCFCLEQALTAISQARALVKGDVVDENHKLPLLEKLLQEALEAA